MTLANSYLDAEGLAARTIAPASLVDGTFIPDGPARVQWVAFVASRLVIATSEVNSRLRKRYAVPFGSAVPETVLGWIVALVTPKLYERRGWDPSDAQAAAILADAELAREQMKEAADSEVGLYDLPLLNTSTADGISKGGPLVYSESSPWAWTDVQADLLRGGGT